MVIVDAPSIGIPKHFLLFRAKYNVIVSGSVRVSVVKVNVKVFAVFEGLTVRRCLKVVDGG